MKRKSLIVLIPMAIIGLAGCNNLNHNSESSSDICEQYETYINETNIEVKEGEKFQLHATTSVRGCVVVWASDNNDVATVDANGLVTGVSSSVNGGIAHISANGVQGCIVTVKPEEQDEPEPLGPAVDVTFKGYNCSYLGNEQYHIDEVVTFQIKPNDGYAFPKHINVLGMDNWEYNNENGLVKGTVREEVFISARSYELGVNYYISHVIENETYFKNDIKYTYDKDTRTVTIEHDRFQKGQEDPYWIYYEIYRYNEQHQLIYSSTDQNGPETRFEYFYDEKGLLTNLTVTNNTSGSFKPFVYETYEYDEKGRKIKDLVEYTDDNNDFYGLFTYGEDYVEERWHYIENGVDIFSNMNRIYTSFDYDNGTRTETFVEYIIEDGVETSTVDYSFYEVYDIKTDIILASGEGTQYEERYIYNDNYDLLRKECTIDNENRIEIQSHYNEDGLLTTVDYFYEESDMETPDYQDEFTYNDEGLVTHWGETNSDSPFSTEITYQDLGDIDWVPSEMVEGITIGQYSYYFPFTSSIN